MEGLIKRFKLFAHKPETNVRDYNNQLYGLKNFTDHPYWSSMKDIFTEETRTLNSQLLNCKNNDERNIVIGQIKEIDRILRITESKANRPYLEEYDEQEKY